MILSFWNIESCQCQFSVKFLEIHSSKLVYLGEIYSSELVHENMQSIWTDARVLMCWYLVQLSVKVLREICLKGLLYSNKSLHLSTHIQAPYYWLSKFIREIFFLHKTKNSSYLILAKTVLSTESNKKIKQKIFQR